MEFPNDDGDGGGDDAKLKDGESESGHLKEGCGVKVNLLNCSEPTFPACLDCAIPHQLMIALISTALKRSECLL
jgi:hypothetical protein